MTLDMQKLEDKYEEKQIECRIQSMQIRKLTAERNELHATVERCISEFERLQSVLGEEDHGLVTALLQEIEEKEPADADKK